MFSGLNGMDWLFIVAALALGFGMVKFMLAVKPPRSADEVPSATPTSESDPDPAVDVPKDGR